MYLVCLLTQTTAEDLWAEKLKLHKHGHKGIISMDPKAKMEAVTTFTATYIPPKSPGVRLRGSRLGFSGRSPAQTEDCCFVLF